jgi:hypothetical protein
MFGLSADMSGGNRIYSVQARICPAKWVNALQKSRSGAKTINLGPDKLMTCKQDTIKHI